VSSSANGASTFSSELLTTFYIGQSYYGIEVLKVQEVTGNPTIVPVPLAPDFIRGLINLRGQLATALGLRALFGEAAAAKDLEEMSVVCRAEGNLVSLIVDEIGDVLEVEGKNFEATPESLPVGIKRFVKGVYKLDGKLLSVLDLERITKELLTTSEKLEVQN